MKMLKEWSAVIGALESGEQTVLLRKGGIMETASGFRVESRRFLLYPTWEHQGVESIREPFRRHLDRPKPDGGANTVSSYAEVLEEADISSDEAIRRLEPFHVWSPGYVAARRRWQPQRPIKAVFLRVFRAGPVSVPTLPQYAGCKSWLDSEADLSRGEPVVPGAESGLGAFREAVA